MRKLYKHKVYDTSTSERICQTPFGYLYRKNSTLSFYLVSRNELNITPLKWIEAEQLIRNHGTRKQYEQLFRPMRYHDPVKAKKRISVNISQDDYSMLRILAGHRGMSIGRYLHATVAERYKALEHRMKESQGN